MVRQLYTNEDNINVVFNITDVAPMTNASMSQYVNGVLYLHHFDDETPNGLFSLNQTTNFDLQPGTERVLLHR